MVEILGADGRPMQTQSPAASRASMIAGGNGVTGSVPYDSASNTNNRMADWQPFLYSPDSEINIWRDRMVSRSRDIVRNDGWATSAVMRTRDNVLGSIFRPISKPDYRALEYYTGNKAFDAKWAAEFGRAVDANYRSWAEDTNRYCDAARRLTVAQILGLAFQHKLIDGDAIAAMEWLPERIGLGKARYATAVQLIDPDRLSNPQNQFDNQTWRGGVIVDHRGAANAYWIRRAHLGDWFNAADAMVWDRVERETAWGRPVVVHDFDPGRAGQHRGGVGILNPVLQKIKMLYTYDNAELDQAVINSIFGAYIKSPFDPELVQSALGNTDLPAYQQARSEFHKGKNIALGGARIPHLFPGEDFVTVKAEHPSTAYADFQATFLRNFAATTGTSYEQLSADWSKSNYSSARGALIEAWKTFQRRRTDFAIGFANPIFSCFVEESFDVDDLPMPKGAPEFSECRPAYSACRWIGPGKGYIDPVKERTGAMLGVEAAFSTLEQEAAENGCDWEDNVNQRKIEVDRFKELGLPVPSWGQESEETIQTERIG